MVTWIHRRRGHNERFGLILLHLSHYSLPKRRRSILLSLELRHRLPLFRHRSARGRTRWPRGREREWRRRSSSGSGRGSRWGERRVWRSSPWRMWRPPPKGERGSAATTNASTGRGGGGRKMRGHRGSSSGGASVTWGRWRRRPSFWWPVASVIAASALASTPSSIGEEKNSLFLGVHSFNFLLILHVCVEF